MSENGKEILAGSASGIVQVLTGQPFDTIKVRLQSASKGEYQGTFDCIRKTISKDGLSALYKGTLSPLIGISFCVSIQFATLEQTKRWFTSLNGGDHQVTPFQFYLAGGIAGLSNSLVSGPVEHIRTRMQVQSSGSDRLYTSTLDCLRKIYGEHGIRGVYKGQGVTMIREWQGYGGYFFAYEVMARFLAKQVGCKVSELPTWKVMACGAMAGYAMWLPVFPVDVLKSKIQTDSFEVSKQKYSGILDCLRKTVKTEGYRGLYRGLVPCMLRAGPVNASTFVAYEYVMRYLSPDR